ncbi:MAG TPA: dihydrodipicolinate reductase [Mycobacteriales bacterium]|nr:dihydrodipicolinate reductase [Mycobacteriales bacterium]
MTYRVIQWATGGAGKAAIEGVLAHPELELVGCLVYSDDKDGRDVGTILGGEPIGVTATKDQQAALAIDADCVIYTPLMPNADEVATILRAGKNVVTPVGWFYKTDADAEVEKAALDGGVTLHGTGINPGGITEKFPLLVSSLVSAATHVRAEEFSDIRSYNAPDVVRWIMCFGRTPEDAMASPMQDLLTHGFTQSMRMILDTMRFPEAQVETTHEIAVATAPIDSPIGVIEPGQVAGQRFIWDAVVEGESVVRVAVNWLMGEEDLEPAWSFGEAGQRFEVEITGDPTTLVTFKGWHPHTIEAGLVRNPGVVATAMHCVNSVPYVCEARPGLASYLDLPLVAGRAAVR